jgi:hypothetical protein
MDAASTRYGRDGRRQPAGITGHCNPPGRKGTDGEAMGFGDLGAGRVTERGGNGACCGRAGIRELTEGRREKTE